MTSKLTSKSLLMYIIPSSMHLTPMNIFLSVGSNHRRHADRQSEVRVASPGHEMGYAAGAEVDKLC